MIAQCLGPDFSGKFAKQSERERVERDTSSMYMEIHLELIHRRKWAGGAEDKPLLRSKDLLLVHYMVLL